ncbi:hypothetical protein [Sphingobacterium sp. T2]|uniref:hypothetical protein n=1 Tax=Sphingobacterium sp. T2 TaxID=1590596 RepID=UPI000AB52FD3|nr:hypothetical protein [Sphingobacterium sp. T2]
MIKLLRKIHTLLYFAAVLLFFIPFYPILYFFTRQPQKYYKQIVWCRKWISIMAIHLVGITI